MSLLEDPFTKAHKNGNDTTVTTDRQKIRPTPSAAALPFVVEFPLPEPEKPSCVGPEEVCMTSIASVAVLAGFSVPNAQRMSSGARLLLSFYTHTR